MMAPVPKDGNKAFYHRTRKNAAMRAAKRRGRGKHSRWLRTWPTPNNDSNNGNAGKPPRYIAGPQPERLK